MAELLLELYSEEIPPSLQIGARDQLKFLIENSLKEKRIKFKNLQVYSSPTRLTLFVQDIPLKTKIAAQEIRGPKVGSPEEILEGFAKSKNQTRKDLFEKITEKS